MLLSKRDQHLRRMVESLPGFLAAIGLLVLQRLDFVSTSPPQLFASSGGVAFLGDAISLHSPVAPRDDFVLVPLT